jgi:MoxR-like ATPase
MTILIGTTNFVRYVWLGYPAEESERICLKRRNSAIDEQKKNLPLII